MANSKSKAKVAETEVDDLLNDNTTVNQGEGTSEGTETEELIEFNGEQLTKAQVEEKIKEMQATVKNLKAAAKGEKPKATRTVKGVMVAFKNKAGDVIVGPGVQYYVARHGGKLHYKEASQVILLPEGWKDGDPIPELETETPETVAE